MTSDEGLPFGMGSSDDDRLGGENAPAPPAWALIVVDGHHRIRWHDEAFRRDFASLRPESPHPAHDAFGNAIGCINAVVEERACGRTTRCPHCTLYQLVQRTIRDNVAVGPVSMERTVVDGGAMPELSLLMVSRPVIHQGERLAAIRIRKVETHHPR